MTITVTWGTGATNIGFAQPWLVADFFHRAITGEEAFALTTIRKKKLVFDGSLEIEGQQLDLTLAIQGKGIRFEGEDLVAGTFKSFKAVQNLPEGGREMFLKLEDWNISATEVSDAVERDEEGDIYALDDVLYGDGWNYTGGRGVDIITPDEGMSEDGAFFRPIGDDVFRGGDDHDVINGFDGNDRIFGGKGRDSLDGGLGRDKIFGGGGADNIVGDFGYWDGAADVLRGGGGGDTIYGAAKGDKIIGGKGNDYMSGGQGNDVFVFNNKSGDDFLPIFHQNGRETLKIKTKKDITVTKLLVEDELESGPWKGEYFDRGYLVEWGNNSVYVNTYARLGQLGIDDYDLG